ncbi:hypothetical protein VE01_06257 [Pseudogymnoascus verrucosus]|uniref:2EXR domain-containing protein n=1 Tax=Pseudogymnoascus verrucosus TaxID=342668 RepID=A0A1B8GFZ9_9PEZI|nr:uncharacterized protein VE01_06257 [Pseudogymnoascus verrucosus]OBT94751.1 hypothetical protein VE01_06257 [Pseudogymnoascus verrucosus]
MTTSAGGESKQLPPSSSSSSSTFPHFPDLPLELRIQIWQHALHSARNSVIPVVINHHPLLTFHSCITLHGSFCGQHGHCPLYNPDSAQQPSSSLVSMINGYFCLGANTPDIDDAGVRELSRVCRESHQVFLSMYPETMTVYREMWYPNVEIHPRRRVRCNPKTDTVLVTALTSYASEQRHPSSLIDGVGDAYQDDLGRWFPPRDTAGAFEGFRRIVAGWRRVVFGFLDEFETPIPSLRLSGTYEDPQFRRFLVFFEGLEWLYLCADKGHVMAGTETEREWERMERVGESCDGGGSVDDDNW